MSQKQFPAGFEIFRIGDPSGEAYVIHSGQVELHDASGARWVLDAGHLFGEMSLINAAPHATGARAVTDVLVHTYSEQDLEALVYQAPNEVQQLVMHLVERLTTQNKQVSAANAIAAAPAPAPAAGGLDSSAVSALLQGLDRMTQSIEKAVTNNAGSAPRVPAEGGTDGSGESHAERSLKEVFSEEMQRELADLGAIMPLLEDESINDVLVNGHGQIYVERRGRLEPTDITFANEAEVLKVADKIVRSIGRKVDRRRPLVDARLLDGSRVNIIAPPLAVDGTSISIRKFAKKKITLDLMREQNNLSPQLADFLRICGKVRLNIVISGGTGAGKTTLLNAVSQSIDHSERVVTIEDAAELQLQQPHVVRLETRPITSGANSREEVTMRDLVKNALRMRPDRILVGEVRGPEAFDMMQAMNTGHEGSLTTVHANHPRDALSRLENMVSMANLNIPFTSIRYQIASAINLIIQISRMRDGHRRITHVSEIVGMEGDIITMQDLFNFVLDGEDAQGQLRGQFKWSGIMPRFLRRVVYHGEGENLSKALGVRLPKL